METTTDRILRKRAEYKRKENEKHKNYIEGKFMIVGPEELIRTHREIYLKDEIPFIEFDNGGSFRFIMTKEYYDSLAKAQKNKLLEGRMKI